MDIIIVFGKFLKIKSYYKVLYNRKLICKVKNDYIYENVIILVNLIFREWILNWLKYFEIYYYLYIKIF